MVTRSGKCWIGDIVEVRIAYFRVFIPPIHGIDGLGQLCAASLVDAASVDPQPLISVLLSPLAALKDLSVAITLANFVSVLHGHLREFNHLVIIHFFPDPPMGQDRVLCFFVTAEVKDFGSTIHSPSLCNQTLPLKKSFYVDQAHAAQVCISLDGIIDCEWHSYL